MEFRELKFASEQLSGVLGGMDLLVAKTRPVLDRLNFGIHRKSTVVSIL
jgi:hypothetical protein